MNELETYARDIAAKHNLCYTDNTISKMDTAYLNFCKKTDNAISLAPVYEFMAKNLNTIAAEKITVNGNAETGRLNITFRLADNYVLSVNKMRETIEDNLVGFNIFHNRDLLISDIIEIEQLSSYINSVNNLIV